MIFSGVGRLTRDCEVKQAGQSTVCKFNIACNDNYSKDKTHFFNCVSFGKQGDIIAKWFSKGSKIYIYGFIKQESWTDSTTGNKKSAVCLHVDGFEFVDSKKESGSTAETVAGKFSGEIVNAPSFSDDDIPF